jgi:hypothetical protein
MASPAIFLAASSGYVPSMLHIAFVRNHSLVELRWMKSVKGCWLETDVFPGSRLVVWS